MALTESTYRNRVHEEIEKIPGEYLPSVLKMMRAFRESVTLRPAEESFRQGFEEALAGDTLPISRLWEGIDED